MARVAEARVAIARRPVEVEDVASSVFERLPHALFVTAIGGCIVAHNTAAGTLFGAAIVAGQTRCCELLGCGQPGTPLEPGCLSQLALREYRPLPEIRVDLPHSDEAVWATAAPLDEAGRVVIQLRPGMRGDRRRRTEPHWISGPRLRIQCFGALRIESEAGPLAGEWTQQRAGQVLGYLLCERNRSVRPDELAEALWPEVGGAVLGTVRYFVHVLRDRLEPGRAKRTPSAFIVFGGGGYAINRDLVQIDAEDFEREVKAGLAAGPHNRQDAERHLTQALHIYTGDFLEDHRYAEWARTERDRLHVLASRGVRALLELRRDAGDMTSVWALQARLAEMEPLDDGVHRDLIVHDLCENRHSEAVRRYRSLRERMMRELGSPPTFTLSELSEAAAGSRERA